MPMTDSIDGKVFLYIVAMAILDLRHRDPAQAEKFISDLQFQAEHIINLIPESRRHLSRAVGSWAAGAAESCTTDVMTDGSKSGRVAALLE